MVNGMMTKKMPFLWSQHHHQNPSLGRSRRLHSTFCVRDEVTTVGCMVAYRIASCRKSIAPFWSPVGPPTEESGEKSIEGKRKDGERREKGMRR